MGDRPPLRALYEAHAHAVLGRCRYLLRSEAEAEDAMQEVFLLALRHADQLSALQSERAWLLTLATRHCLNAMRGGRTRREGEVELKGRAQLRLVVGGAAQDEDRDAVRRALALVDEESQLAAVLYHVDELTLVEVAEQLGRSVPTVRKRLVEFAERARALLEPEAPQAKVEGGGP